MASGAARPAPRETASPSSGMTVYCSAAPSSTSFGRVSTSAKSCGRVRQAVEARQVMCRTPEYLRQPRGSSSVVFPSGDCDDGPAADISNAPMPVQWSPVLSWHLEGEASAHGEHGERQHRSRILRAEPRESWRMRQAEAAGQRHPQREHVAELRRQLPGGRLQALRLEVRGGRRVTVR